MTGWQREDEEGKGQGQGQGQGQQQQQQQIFLAKYYYIALRVAMSIDVRMSNVDCLSDISLV